MNTPHTSTLNPDSNIPPRSIDWRRFQNLMELSAATISKENARAALVLGEYDEGQDRLALLLEWGKHAFAPGNEFVPTPVLRYTESRELIDWCSLEKPAIDVVGELETLVSSLLDRAKLDAGDSGIKCLRFGSFTASEYFAITLKAIPNAPTPKSEVVQVPQDISKPEPQ